MTASGDWGEIIDVADAKRFVGREQELVIFRQQMALAKPDYLIFYISGQGGVGKTTLLNRCRDIANDLDFLSADCDEQQKDIPAVLGRFAYQLADQGHALKKFDERYRVYRQKMSEIENDPEAPQGLAALLGKTFVRAAFIGGDMLPGVRKGLEYIPQDVLENQASEWTTYLMKKLTNKDDIILVREPVTILAPLFFEDLNEISKRHRVLLSFENFEATRQELQKWLLHLREYRPSRNIRLIIAGRDLPGTNWDLLRGVTLNIHLDVFTEKEAEEFLDIYKVLDARRRREIIESSDRLPVLMSWLATEDDVWLDSSVPTYDIVDRILRWDNDKVLRQAALLASLPRIFNVDILDILLSSDTQDISTQYVFDWLQTVPFVRQCSDGWKYHDVVRRMMLHYQRQKSPQTYCHRHQVLADFYDKSRVNLDISSDKQWANERWRKYTLAYAYHLLAADSARYWGKVMSIFAIAIRRRRAFAVELIEALCSNDILDELSGDQKKLIELFRQQLHAVMQGKMQDGMEMFHRLSRIKDLSTDAKSYMFSFSGECYRLDGEWERGLDSFSKAINLMQNDTWAISSRGQTYHLMEKHEEALVDFNRAIELDEKYTWAIGSRGRTYRLMRKYEEALVDFNRAIELSGKSAWVIGGRGETYRLMGRYEEALVDFNRAIELDEKYAWAIGSRGQTYCLMGRYEEALVDFNRAIELSGKSAWVIGKRGETYRLMRKYEEALVDFNRAIELSGKSAWVIGSRGQTYRSMGRYEEALVDFNRAIELDEKYAWVIGGRGQTYCLMGRYEEALVDFNRAIELDEKYTWAIGRRGEIYRLMGRYEEALVDFKHAIDLDQDLMNEIGLVFSYLGRYEEAIDYYEQVLSKEPDNVFAIYNMAVVMTHWKGLPLAIEWVDRAYANLANVLDPSIKLYGLGGLEALTGHNNLALDYLQQAVLIEEKEVVGWASHDIAWRNLRSNREFQSVIVAVNTKPRRETQ